MLRRESADAFASLVLIIHDWVGVQLMVWLIQLICVILRDYISTIVVTVMLMVVRK